MRETAGLLALGLLACGSTPAATDAGSDGGGDVFAPDTSTNADSGIPASSWTTFDVTTAIKGAAGFQGAAFDGRYVYFVPWDNLISTPYPDGQVIRYDTTASFTASSAWASFNTFGLPNSGGAGGFAGAVFDGKYVYFVPYAAYASNPDGIVARLDTTGTFTDNASWSTFDMSTVDPNAKGFFGGVFDGKYVYFVPNSSLTPAMRLDTTAAFTTASSWSAFTTTTVDANATGFTGGVFDGRYVYFVPTYANGKEDGLATRYDTTATFTSAASWSTFDVATVDPKARGFFGGAFDGHYVYFVPMSNSATTFDGVIARFDTTASFSAAGSWSTFDLAATVSAECIGFEGAAFDGQYLYLAPFVNHTLARLDTSAAFSTSASWSSFGMLTIDSKIQSFTGAVFDGEYVYFAPVNNGVVARYQARSAPSMPNLPGWKGSFL